MIPLRVGGSYHAIGRGLRVTLLKGWHSQVAKSPLKVTAFIAPILIPCSQSRPSQVLALEMRASTNTWH